ncbi:hypothetical protein [Estrella lausannensis]|uniref:Putative ADP/ATP translocase n=1 Tax=Estrella lausannensis TaxID=483423 RepID=A0A0H5E5I8_9BACT|nr:hypothetical protein [Estrella lausannensis]CRX38500.1 putative ADP/ATP translocase [Estrella lausannensis]
MTFSIKTFYFPLAGALLAALTMNILTLGMPESILYLCENSSPDLLLWCKGWGRLLFSSFATIVLIMLSTRFDLQNVTRIMFGIALTGAILYFFYLIPLYLHSPKAGERIADKTLSWIPVSFYLTLSYWPSTIILFLYSFMNRFISLKEAFLAYPLFAIAGIIIPILFVPARQIQAPLPTDEEIFFAGVATVVLSLLSLGLFEWLWRSRAEELSHESKETGKTTLPRGLFWQGGLVLATAFIYQLNKSVWFSKGSLEYPAPQEYTHFLTAFEGLRSLGMLLDVVFLLFVLIALEKRGGRAWKNIFSGVVFVSLIIGFSLIFFNLFSNPHFSHSLRELGSIQAFFESAAVGSGYQIFFTAVSYPILLCLKEMIFMLYEPKKRFTAKLWVDLVYAKIGLVLATVASFMGSSLTLSVRVYLFATVFVAAGLIWLYLALRMGSQIEKKSPAPQDEWEVSQNA